ncbi:response regulator transcription factor [Cohnella silvisoli]|uniref:Response regulator n=1 Tax=Cohnella silvisoli TaxID=2873699 RepID=A0ABV1L0W6_9BACL|nr:response regulator [Cohnella silvisoli]MCD9025276.1 response regulator [Cohnella silvisoli]
MKILIVDDEPRHRRGMANMIHTLRPEDQVLIANDGASALESVRSNEPDVVLTDIRMPNMDGLAFLKQLEDENLQPKVVMVSAYNLFEYAQKAIRHGAYDYLLKPVEAEKVEDVLRRIEELLADESRQYSESEELKHRLSLTSSAYRNRLILSWLNGSLSAAERQELEKLDWIQGNGIVIFSEFRVELGNKAELDPIGLMQRLEQTWAEWGEAHTFPLNALEEDIFQAVTILRTSLHTLDRMPDIRLRVTSLGTEWAKAGQLSHGIGPECRSLWLEAPQAYRAAQSANRYNFHECWNGILFHEEILPSRNPIILDGEKLFEALQGRDANAAIDICQTAFNQLAANGHANPTLIKESAALIIMKIKSRIRDFVDRQVGSALTNSVVMAIPACQTYTELMALLEGRLRDVHDALQQAQLDRSEIIVAECLRWIHEHAKEDLTLERAAEHFFFNPSYFSTWIKSRTGTTFSDHVMEARMQRAKQLLAANRLKIYEIAAECGYQDTKYFCRVFKKQNGMSPEAYKHTSFPQRRGEG